MENRRWCSTYSKVWWKKEKFWDLGILGIFRWEKAQYCRNRRSGPVAMPWREKASIREREREREFWMLVFCSKWDTTQGLKNFRGEIVFLWFDDVSNLRAIGLNKQMRFKPLVWCWCGVESQKRTRGTFLLVGRSREDHISGPPGGTNNFSLGGSTFFPLLPWWGLLLFLGRGRVYCKDKVFFLVNVKINLEYKRTVPQLHFHHHDKGFIGSSSSSLVEP